MATTSEKEYISTIEGYGLAILGLTLRDYFAAKAVQGSMPTLEKAVPEEVERIIGVIARASYMAADAMLAERAK